MIDVKRIMDDLPKQIRRTRAKMVAELLLEGKSTDEARQITEKAHKRAYKAWLRDFADQHRPGLVDAAERTLKREGVL